MYSHLFKSTEPKYCVYLQRAVISVSLYLKRWWICTISQVTRNSLIKSFSEKHHLERKIKIAKLCKLYQALSTAESGL